MLKSIGAFKDDKKKGSDGTYQDSVNAPISWEYDNDVVGHEDEVEDEDFASNSEVVLGEVLLAVEKVSINQIS